MSPRPPYLIFESDAAEDPGLLDKAWREPGTFAFVAGRSGASAEWIGQRMMELPAEFHKGHFVLLTSGSTGRPKLVVGSRDRAERLSEVLHDIQESGPVRETVLALPLTYCYAFVNQWLWSRRHGRRLTLTPGLAQPARLREVLAEAADAMLCLVGAQASLLLQYFGSAAFPGVIRLHFAGGRFPQEQLDALRKLFPRAAIFNNYGCAEAMPRLTLRRAEAGTASEHVGWTLPGVEMRSDPDSRLLFRSAYGAVALGDENGFTRVSPAEWVPTGDLGSQAADGHWEIQGRRGEVFKRHGEKVSLPLILSTVRSLWRGEADAYREQDRAGEAGYTLVLCPRPSDEETRNLLREVSLRHPRAHWPLRVESLPSMPMLPNGKIDRESLVSQAESEVHWKQRV